MAALRLTIFLPSLNGGGAERVMVTLANAIARRGYAVDLVLAAATGPYMKDVSPAVRVVDLKAGRVIKALLPLARYLRNEQPTAMIAAMTHANIVALLAHLLVRPTSRLVVFEHTTISMAHQREQGLPARLIYTLTPLLYPRAHGIGTVSQAASADLAGFAGLPPERVQTIYNPFDLQRIEKLAKEPIDHPWFAPCQIPVLLAVGRLNEAKDFPVLIRAFAQMRKQRSARLLILGEGELRSQLEALATECGLTADDVQMPGFVANPFAYMARSAVFVLSSRWEGLPSALIEAMACGAPVISTGCPCGPHEILEGGRWGRLVPVGDTEALADALAATLDTPRNQLPDVHQRAQDFDQERAVDAYLKAMGVTPYLNDDIKRV